MLDAVLLILGVPDHEDHDVTLRRVNGRLDVVSIEEKSPAMDENLVDKAFNYTRNASKQLVVLQVLTSDLFHWGFNDVILSGPAKIRFIGYVREKVYDKSLEATKILEEKALQYNLPIEIKRIETDDPVSVVLEEARKGYNRIFIGRGKKRIFPLFKKSIEQQLRKNISVPIEN
jgi:hypothetical protein